MAEYYISGQVDAVAEPYKSKRTRVIVDFNCKAA